MATTEKATFGGGCFWCLEAVFQRIEGVRAVVSGYAGGKKPNPTYREVCSGSSGHAEVVQIEFDPAVASYDRLLDAFWECHDPTTMNAQGADIGTQYRSVIFFHDDAQKSSAVRSREKAQLEFSDPIVTEIVPLPVFYPAEDYHQNYFNDNVGAPYCQAVIRPKLRKLGMNA